MNAWCPHHTRSASAVWLLQGPDGRIVILGDGERFAVDVTRTVQLQLHLLGGFEDDAAARKRRPFRRLRPRRGRGRNWWPDDLPPVAVWAAGTSMRLLRDPDEFGGTYLWPHGSPPAGGLRTDAHPAGGRV